MEFNNPVVRRLVVTDGSRSVTIDTIGNLAQILFELFGADIARLSVDSSVTPADFLIQAFFNGNARTQVRFVPGSSFIQFYANNGTATDDCFFYIEAGQPARLSQPLVSTNNAGGTIPETWHGLSYQNSWSNFGSGYSNGQYRLMPDGCVRMRGVPTAGTKTDGTVIATLPTGYRPPATKQYKVPSGGDTNVRIEIETDGEIRVYGMGVNNAIVLDGLTFELALID